MGIIRNLKALYRKSMISRIVSHLGSEASITVTCTQLSRQVNVLDAMHMLKVAWSDVKPQSTTNCFAKAGFISQVTPDEEEALNPPTVMLSSEFETYVDLDISLECHGQLTEEDICTKILQQNHGETSHHDSDDDETSASAASPTPKRGEAMQAMQMLCYFLEKSGADLEQFYTLERQLLQSFATPTTQTSIRDFFPYPLQNTELCLSTEQWILCVCYSRFSGDKLLI